ncbi:Sodium/calcium exchanger protein-domain-containing protein [Pelagophyceae sp. CCMP2097]|nr:Sodium/calcium exchanger protein-domain-containing protein [Pelagophyceae sp. CCMP2097]
MTSDGVDDGVPEWVGDVGLPLAWPILVLATLTLFWALAVVCEERFVPALQVLCDRGKIPDDVAGATLMAAGASSPEVFASLISLFITQSALGVGTVIGSEIFNHLIICAGSVLAARGGVLVLEKRIVLRECSFYLVSCLLLLYVLTHETAQSGNSRVVVVRAWAPAAMLATYAVYVLVCVFFNDLTAKFTRRAHEKLDTEPSENFCGPNDAADGEAETGYASVASTAEQGFVPPRPDLGRYRSLSVRALKRLEVRACAAKRPCVERPPSSLLKSLLGSRD